MHLHLRSGGRYAVELCLAGKCVCSFVIDTFFDVPWWLCHQPETSSFDSYGCRYDAPCSKSIHATTTKSDGDAALLLVVQGMMTMIRSRAFCAPIYHHWHIPSLSLQHKDPTALLDLFNSLLPNIDILLRSTKLTALPHTSYHRYSTSCTSFRFVSIPDIHSTFCAQRHQD